MHGTFTHSDGTEVTLRHKVNFRPSSSHIPIVEFMNHHLLNYRAFSVDMFGAIRNSGFRTLK